MSFIPNVITDYQDPHMRLPRLRFPATRRLAEPAAFVTPVYAVPPQRKERRESHAPIPRRLGAVPCSAHKGPPFDAE